ncbi:Der GTPase-activating protein YihI [Pantoea sp. 1.19]|uniref:Der GTPase-activating protein YihI n=1 Tax=Pantoea sp. 1.19 TaxID=1925589 RepID=UPI000948BE96|nr:Der GTPase-activating protein YihI [Pantoea sp. 1.19]
MKQPARTGQQSGKGKSRREARESLNQQARDRKRDKKRSGHKPGSRANPIAAEARQHGGAPSRDPRLGSKKPVPLGNEITTPVSRAAVPAPKPVEKKPVALSPQEELAALENSERLDTLLDRLEQGDTLSGDDQAWLDQTLDRIDVLMEMLGIALDDDEQDDAADEDMYRLLKGGH